MTNRIYDSALQLIGRTPLVRLKRLSGHVGAEVCAKLESQNPGGSVKDRPALAMVEFEERAGRLLPGATLVLTSAEDGMAGAVEQAERIAAETNNSFMPRQFENPANPEVHALTTAEEIWEATEGKIDAFVAGVGTGGTLTGIARVLKARLPSVRIVAVEPRASAVLSGGQPGLHGIQGLGAGFIPGVLDTDLIDDVVTVTDLAAERMAGRLAREEGFLTGPSAGANVHAALEVARRMEKGQRVVTILCDGGERYLC